MFFCLLTSIGIFVYGFHNILWSLTIYFFLEVFVGNATLHRYFGHNAFEMRPSLRPIFIWLAHHIGVGSVLGWVGHHRWHHEHSDTPLDLHSPKINGVFHILFGTWNANIPRKMVKDLLEQPGLLWWHKNYFKYHLVLIFTLLLFSPWALCFVYALPNLLCLFSGYLIAILPHWQGHLSNSFVTEVFTFGEGWHKNHHENAKAYRFHKFDLTALGIDILLKQKICPNSTAQLKKSPEIDFGQL